VEAALDHRVHGADVRGHHALLADDEPAAHRELTAHLALDVDGVGDLELALHAALLPDDREQRGGRCGRLLGPRGLGLGGAGGTAPATVASEHRSLLAGSVLKKRTTGRQSPCQGPLTLNYLIDKKNPI